MRRSVFFITLGDEMRLNICRFAIKTFKLCNKHDNIFLFLRLEVFSCLVAISVVAQVVWTRFDSLLWPWIFINFNSFVALNNVWGNCKLHQLYFLFKNISVEIYLIPQIPRCPMCRALIQVRTRVFINWRPTSVNNKFLCYCAIFRCLRKLSSASSITLESIF